MPRVSLPVAASLSLLWACAAAPPDADPGSTPPTAQGQVHEGERHFRSLSQLTYGGENAEAYWSFDGRQLVFQSRPAGEGCDQIFRMTVGDPDSVTRVSSGEGATTCSYFMPGGRHVIYASTHLGGAACPPKPDRSQGYVWPLYDTYDIFKVSVDGREPVRLTDAPGYDAEATVCPVDGTILFTSVRDGDLELYTMDADGRNVKRLTQTPGYDGGAFFNPDCTKIVWRASRPTGDALADYQRLLKQNLVRPTKLEIWVANADGSDARQVTYLNAASFAPYWYPNRDRILFSTNHGDPKGREFDIWAVNGDGTELEQITFSPGFDGFPMFSWDGETLAFASNRATAEGAYDTNVFLADWQDAPMPASADPAPAERVKRDVAWLADPARQGRGVGGAGLDQAITYVADRLKELGVAPAFDDGYRQPFEVTTALKVAPSTNLSIGGEAVAGDQMAPLSGSASGTVQAPLVLAGYGIVDEDAKLDDYARVKAKDKIVVVRRFVPSEVDDETRERKLSDLRRKAFLAKQRGAKALVVVDLPVVKAGETMPEEAPFPPLESNGYGDAGIPMVIVKRERGAKIVDALSKGRPLTAELTVALEPTRATTANVVGRLAADGERRDGVVVIGAHLDHLGMGGPSSLAPGVSAPHLGADDNASGIAALLEAARRLASTTGRQRDVIFAAFSAEELGVLGSSHFVEHLPAGMKAKDIVAMINMDMVGRLRDNTLQVLGGDSAEEWADLTGAVCDDAQVTCAVGGDGYGPSDQTPFYAAGIPVLHFFTGPHADYHKPSDSPDRVHAIGVAKTAEIVAGLSEALMARADRLTYRQTASPTPSGDRRSYGASLGTVPDYAGPKGGQKGMLLAGVRPGGAADQAGMRRGDVLVRLGTFEIGGVRDLMYALQGSKPGQTLEAVVLRDGKRVSIQVTLQESQGRGGGQHGAPEPKP